MNSKEFAPFPAKRLNEYLTSDLNRFVKIVESSAASLDINAYLVGGIIRDWLLNLHSTDLDFVFIGDAIRVGEVIRQDHGGKLVVHRRFGTCKWFPPEDMQPCGLTFIDLITARKESYPQPAALPVVEFSTLQDDLFRRDFTINAMAYNLTTDEIVDPYAGLNDLKNHTIRVLHDQSFIDDPTRIFRAVRFEQRLNFSFDQSTEGLLRAAIPGIELLSGERIQHELNLILSEADPVKPLLRLAELGILKAIHPGLTFAYQAAGLIQQVSSTSLPEWPNSKKCPLSSSSTLLPYSAWLSTLTAEVRSQFLERIKFPHKERKSIQQALALIDSKDALASTSPSRTTITLDKLTEDAICVSYHLSSDPAFSETLTKYITQYSCTFPSITGDDLIRRGLAPGPSFESILWSLRAAKLDGIVTSERDETDFLEQLLHSAK